MAYTKDADGFMVPPTPSSTIGGQSRSSSASRQNEGGGTSSGSAPGRLVEDSLYRRANLATNKVFYRNRYDALPEHATDLVAEIKKTRDSPEPSAEELAADPVWRDLNNGVSEPKVADFFRDSISTTAAQQQRLLATSTNQEMFLANVPTVSGPSRVSKPKPDMLYGYDYDFAFTEQQKTQLNSMQRAPVANSEGLVYPFFVIEFKGDGPASTGNMWVATNQCMGGSATCVSMAETLNRELHNCRQPEVQPVVDSSAFSIAMDGSVAQLYISWREEDLSYFVANVQGFLLQEPEHYLMFRRYVRNIIDWGKDKRLKEIQRALDFLLEESRLRVSEAAKSRPPPETDDFEAGSSTSSSKRGRPLQRGGRGRGSTSRSRSHSQNGGRGGQ